MKSGIAFLAFTIFVLTGCSKGTKPVNSDSNNTSPQTSFNINGTYDTDFGELILKEENKKVTGTYSYPGENETNVSGSLSGDLKETVLSFNWEQIQGNEKAGGPGKFTFSNDAKSFKGTWQDGKGKSGDWNGTKK